jgi:hypothetical protein
VPTTPSANSRCGAGTVTFSATAPSGCTIDWYDAASGGSIVSGGSGVVSFAPSINSSTTYYAQARNTSTSCVSATRLTVIGTINAPATITIHPESHIFCTVAATPTLTVTATAGSGQTLSYQWKTGSGDGTNVGTDASSYIPTVTAKSDFWVVVSDNNSCSVTSNKATITLSDSAAGRIGNDTVCSGNNGGKIGYTN